MTTTQLRTREPARFGPTPAAAVRAWAVAVAVCWAVLGAHALDADRMERTMQQRYGAPGVQAFGKWRALLATLRGAPDTELLRRVNEHWNRSVRFADDTAAWGREDYWATPLETLGRGQGDCEDYVIAKYFSLRELGVAEARLRLTYVRARIGSADSGLSQAHMVLSYYPTPEAVPLVLDNLVGEIRLASARPDLTPVFSFNAEGVYTGAAPAAPVERLTRWRDLVARMQGEGHLP